LPAAVGILTRLASRWVAGIHMEDALKRAAELNKLRIGAILNILGEHYEDRKSIEETTAEYLELIKAITDRGLDASISIKLSQCGLMIDEEYCRQNVDRILAKVKETGKYLWMDMEGSKYTDATIRIYEHCLKLYPEVGLAVQTNLKRTEADVRSLMKVGGMVRLTKGAYREDPAISYPKRSDATANYSRILKILFEEGERFAVATHDIDMIDETLELSRTHKPTFEFQMLQGVRETLAAELAGKGYRVNEYVPYGPRWLAYFSRRLKERPSNVITMFRSLISG
jgi:proline dehydrogenase